MYSMKDTPNMAITAIKRAFIRSFCTNLLFLYPSHLISLPSPRLLLPQPLTLPHPKPSLKNTRHLLQAQPRRLGITKHTKHPPKRTQARVEPERARGGDARHEREVRAVDE